MHYLHFFTKKQPDLNWENPKVLEKIIDDSQVFENEGLGSSVLVNNYDTVELSNEALHLQPWKALILSK